MSTREQHPIDDHFRRSLAAAEVEPPAHVWASVAAAQRGSDRRWGLWFWPLLLLVGVGVAGAFQFFGKAGGDLVDADIPTNGAKQHASTAGAEALLSVADTRTTAGSSTHVGGADGDATETATARAPRLGLPEPKASVPPSRDLDGEGSPDIEASTVAAGSSASSAATVTKGSTYTTVPAAQGGATPSDKAEGAEELSNSAQGAMPKTAAEADALWAADLDLRPRRMSILPMALTMSVPDRAPYRANPTTDHYVLPRGEWWVGPAVGLFSTKLRWQGDDRELAEAINRTMGTRTEPAFGPAFGYTWRSGWGISSGLFWQQGEQQRRLSDRRTDVEQEIISSVVSLDAQVIVSSTDTLITTTTTETEFSGVERSTVLRIPIQGHWHGNRGRLLYGAQLGLVVERSSFRGGPTLVRDASDGRIVPVSDASVSGQDRQPLTLSGSAGLELGYQLHERWALRGGPLLMHGLASMQRPENVFALPDRLGLQFLLVHHIHRRSFR